MTNQSKSVGELLRPRIEPSKIADLNEDDVLNPIKIQTVLLLGAFSSLSNIVTLTTAAKQFQTIGFIERLAG